MLKAWYHHKKNGQRMLSLKTIAAHLDCEMKTVQGLFGGSIVSAGADGEDAVDAGEVVSFLVRNNMPVNTSLLPPNSLKILIITMENQEAGWQRDYIELILSHFKERGNLLVDYTPAGKFANLTFLTFVPDVVVYFLQEIDHATAGTLSLLSNFPELSTIVAGDEAVLKSLQTNQMLQDCLALSNTLQADQLNTLLNSTYNDR